LDCFFVTSSRIFGVQQTYYKYLVIFIVPYAIILLTILGWIIYFKFRHQKINWDKVITTIVVLIFTFQPMY
jgi:hypothetical protein